MLTHHARRASRPAPCGDSGGISPGLWAGIASVAIVVVGGVIVARRRREDEDEA